MDDGHIRHLPVAPIEPRPQMVLQRLEAMPPPALAAANSPPSHVRSPAPSSCSAGSPGLSPTHRPQQQQQQQRPTTPGRTTPLLDMRAVAKPIDMEQLHQLPPDMLELYRSVQEIMVYQSAFVPIEVRESIHAVTASRLSNRLLCPANGLAQQGDRFSSVIPARRPAILGQVMPVYCVLCTLRARRDQAPIANDGQKRRQAPARDVSAIPSSPDWILLSYGSCGDW